uniref:Retinoic acid induced 2 n=1 Tax=Aquila chrysaetos chrysaetos TaxID=223781 RepID=A0A663E2X5_AQUCH
MEELYKDAPNLPMDVTSSPSAMANNKLENGVAQLITAEAWNINSADLMKKALSPLVTVPAPSILTPPAESQSGVALKVAATVLQPICLGDSPVVLPIHLQVAGSAAPQMPAASAATPYVMTTQGPVPLPVLLEQHVFQHLNSPLVLPPGAACPASPLHAGLFPATAAPPRRAAPAPGPQALRPSAGARPAPRLSDAGLRRRPPGPVPLAGRPGLGPLPAPPRLRRPPAPGLQLAPLPAGAPRYAAGALPRHRAPARPRPHPHPRPHPRAPRRRGQGGPRPAQAAALRPPLLQGHPDPPGEGGDEALRPPPPAGASPAEPPHRHQDGRRERGAGPLHERAACASGRRGRPAAAAARGRGPGPVPRLLPQAGGAPRGGGRRQHRPCRRRRRRGRRSPRAGQAAWPRCPLRPLQAPGGVGQGGGPGGGQRAGRAAAAAAEVAGGAGGQGGLRAQGRQQHRDRQHLADSQSHRLRQGRRAHHLLRQDQGPVGGLHQKLFLQKGPAPGLGAAVLRREEPARAPGQRRGPQETRQKQERKAKENELAGDTYSSNQEATARCLFSKKVNYAFLEF